MLVPCSFSYAYIIATHGPSGTASFPVSSSPSTACETSTCKSPFIPFIFKIVPSDTYKIWKFCYFQYGRYEGKASRKDKLEKVADIDSDVAGSEVVLSLELDEDENGFLVAENPS
ncbi:hypothetical protein HN51_017989 [Arachis hypogaea]